MRLRYRAVDCFHEASRSSREECLRHALPLPLVTCLEEGVYASSTFDGAFTSCHRNLLVNSASPKISLELPQDFPCVEETNICDKFLWQMFPRAQQLHRPSIDPGTGVVAVSESMYNWFCSDLQRKLQIQEEDVNMACSRSQRIVPREINEEDVNTTYSRSQKIDISEMHETTPKPIAYDKVPYASSSSGQSSFARHVKEAKPRRSTISEFVEIEAPLLDWRNCIPRPEHVSLLSLSQDWSRVILEIGGAPLSAVETKEEAAFQFTVPQARLNDIQELRQVEEACHSRQYPDNRSNPLVKIEPIETLLIPEKLCLQTGGEKEMTYPIEPNCLLQWFESHGDKIIEKEAESLRMGDFNTEMSVVDILTSKLIYHDEYLQPAMLPRGLLRDQCDFQPCGPAVIDSATGSFRGSKLTFEIPRTYDWNLSSLANTNPTIIAKDETEIPMPDLPGLHPSRTFESSVVMPELSLDDHQFQSLPVPVVTSLQDDLIDAELGRLMSFNRESFTVPATDWLYLDWHFFHGLKCTNAACFSLRAQLTEASQCRPLPSTFMTADVVTSKKRSELVLELRLLEDHDCHRDLSPNSHAIGTEGQNIEALLRSPLPGFSQTRGEESFRAPKETQKPQERVCKSLLQTPCATSPTSIDVIAANGFLPAFQESTLLQNQCSPGAEGRNVDLEVQIQKYNINPVSKQRPHLRNLQPVERVGIGEPDFMRTFNAGEDLPCKSQEEKPTNDPASRRDLRPICIQNDFDLMENDIDFFVQARKGIPISGTDQHITKDSNENSSTAVNDLQCISTSQPALLTTRESDERRRTTVATEFCVHEIEFSLEIRTCMVSLSSNYSALLALDEIVELKISGKLKVLTEFGFDADGNGHLTLLISDVASEPASHQRHILLRGLISLHVLRHTALNLCDYGIQVAHLYMENCFERMPFLEGHIMSSRTELEEAYNQVERGVVEDHPKLCSLDMLLRPDALEVHDVKYLSRRILLLADRRAFFTVVRKLVSLGLTPYQIDRKESYLHNGVLQKESTDKLKEEVLEALTFSDCLLVSYAYLNPSFPVERFTMIIQYADPQSMDTTNSNWTTEKCEIHFFKLLVHPEDFQVKCSSTSAQRQASDYQDPQAYNLGGFVNLLKPNAAALAPSTDQPLGQSSSLKKDMPLIENEPPRSSSFGGAKEQLLDEHCQLDRQCEMIIVANISHPNDHMLTGRRSSYQKILHLEKENLQVVERELRLPVDLILSPASCLVIYTLGKLKLEPQSLKDKQTALQNDVVTHLKAISFSFRDCIMIFEGPTEFTTAALGIFTHIYALALALEMQFQCFASRHPEVTDTIMMHSIRAVRRSRHMSSCPIMTEGPTLAEVFLTEFPSINPLAAHAILSSGKPLPVFMSYTPEQQFAAVEDYKVLKHCLDLFKAQCIYKAIATNTIAVSNCKVVESQTNRAADEEILYLREPYPQAANLPHQRSTSEVCASFPEFPPAFAINDYSPAYYVSNTHKITDYPPAYSGSNTHKICDYSPAYNVSNAHQMISFPDFPPISEVRGCEVDDPQERELSSTDLHELFDIFQQSPAEVAGTKSLRWSHASDTADVPLYEGAAPDKNDARSGFQHPQEMYALDDMEWLKGFGCELGGSDERYGAEKCLQWPQNSSAAAHYEVEDHSFELERGYWPRETSAAPVNGSKRSSGGLENPHGGYEILQNSAEISGRGILPRNWSAPTDGSEPFDAKRGASSLSFISPTVYAVHRQETDLETALGSWNDHKRIRGVARSFEDETLDLQEEDNDNHFTSKAPTGPSYLDEFAAVRADWIDNTASVQEEGSFMSRSSKQQSRRPQTAPLRASSLDKFRHRPTRSPAAAPGTVSKNYTQAKIKCPRKPAPPRSRKQPPRVTPLRPATIANPAFAKKAPAE